LPAGAPPFLLFWSALPGPSPPQSAPSPHCWPAVQLPRICRAAATQLRPGKEQRAAPLNGCPGGFGWWPAPHTPPRATGPAAGMPAGMPVAAFAGRPTCSVAVRRLAAGGRWLLSAAPLPGQPPVAWFGEALAAHRRTAASGCFTQRPSTLTFRCHSGNPCNLGPQSGNSSQRVRHSAP
jgi:hypothetical protein